MTNIPEPGSPSSATIWPALHLSSPGPAASRSRAASLALAKSGIARSSSAVTPSSYHARAAIPAQRSQSGNQGAQERPHERQRPIVGDSTSTRRRATTRAAAASSSAAARSIVTPPTPGYWSANQRRMLASRPARSASSSDDAAQPRGVEQEVQLRARDAISGDRERERCEELEAVLVHGCVDELPRVRRGKSPASLGEPPLHRLESQPERLQRLDREPALVRPLAQRDPVPGDERRVQLQRVLHAEIGKLRPDPRLVDCAVAEVPAGKRDVRLERGLDELGIRRAPAEPGEHADVPALDEPEAPGAAGDLRELPREQVAPLLAVELRRLGEEERLAGKVHSVPEDVGRDADIGRARQEAVDLLAPGGSGIAP